MIDPRAEQWKRIEASSFLTEADRQAIAASSNHARADRLSIVTETSPFGAALGAINEIFARASDGDASARRMAKRVRSLLASGKAHDIIVEMRPDADTLHLNLHPSPELKLLLWRGGQPC